MREQEHEEGRVKQRVKAVGKERPAELTGSYRTTTRATLTNLTNMMSTHYCIQNRILYRQSVLYEQATSGTTHCIQGAK
jgi:hypothetical protein